MSKRIKNQQRGRDVYVPWQLGQLGVRFICCLCGHLSSDWVWKHILMCDCWMSIPICLHVCLWVTAPFLCSSTAYRTHSISEYLEIEAHTGTQWTGHLAPATVRLMRNTVRQGRWQLHQEVGPQQAKGPCAHRSCPDTRWSDGCDGWLGDSPERVAEQVEAGRSGGNW